MQQNSDDSGGNRKDAPAAKDDHALKVNVPRPKRGAIPTPKERIETAIPYTPGNTDSESDPPVSKLPSPGQKA